MTALVIANVVPSNGEKMGEYAAVAAKILATHGGKIVHRGKFEKALLGKAAPHGLSIIWFPSSQAAKAWFSSTEYQPIAPPRDEAASMTFLLYDLAF